MRGVWLVVALSLVAACSASNPGPHLAPPQDAGGDDDAMDPPIPPPDTGPPPDLATICGGKVPQTADDWERCYQKRECERYVACVSLNNYRNVQDCEDSWDDVDGGIKAAARRERLRAVELGTATVNPTAFEACLDRTNTSRCIDPAWDVNCAERYTGKVADGQTCLTATDCASPGAVCDTDAGTNCPGACCAGTCKAKAKTGQACASYEDCGPGLWCNNKVCASGALGAACSDFFECDFDLWCDMRAHRCKALLPDGAACTDITQCGAGHTCIGLSISNANPGTCRPNAHPGDPCDSLCYGNLYCDGSKHTCHALPVLAESCSPLIPCAGTNTICSSGACVLRSDQGVGCGDQSCLPELFCTSDRGEKPPLCEARGGTGAKCGKPDDCESYLCSADGNCLAWQDHCP